MKRYFEVLTLALAFVSFSCTKNLETEGNVEEQEVKMMQVEIEATADNDEGNADETKVTVNGTVTSWEKGDKATVFVYPISGSAYPPYPFTVSKVYGENNKKAIFAGQVPVGTKKYLGAVYPQDQNSVWHYTLRVENYTIPAVQNGSFSNVVFYGKPKSATQETEDNKKFEFTCICGIIKLTVPAELKVRAIILRSNKELAGTFSIDGASGREGKVPANNTQLSKTSKKITISAPEGEILSGDVYAAVLPQSSGSDLQIQMDIVNSEMKCVSMSKSGMKTLVKGTISKFGTMPNTLTFDKDALAFSIGNGKFVRFAESNLQYVPNGDGKGAITGKWRFAEHPWDYVGGEVDKVHYGNVDGSSNNIPTKSGAPCDDAWLSSYTGCIDLFGWGATGEGNTIICASGGNNDSQYYNSYVNGLYSSLNPYVRNGYDWGSKIEPEMNWRTMTQTEWVCLNNRETGNSSTTAMDNNPVFNGPATVCGTKGLIILPDLFIEPVASSTNGGYFKSRKDGATNYDANIYDEAGWAKMAASGAVFLPITLMRRNLGDIYPQSGNNNDYGCYWCSDTNTTYLKPETNAKLVQIQTGSGQLNITSNTTRERYFGHAVRLVRDVNN